MSKCTKRIVLPILFTLGCSLAGGPAGAAIRHDSRLATGGWLSQFLVHLPFGPGKYGCQVDPNGEANPTKYGCQVDPDGQPKPNKAGTMVDPNGGSPQKP